MGIVAFGFVLAACAGSVDSGDEPAPEATPAKQPAAAEPEVCTQPGVSETCTTATGAAGARLCQAGAQGDAWSDCAPTAICEPGDEMACFGPGSSFGALATGCTLMNGKWQFDPSGCNTPLVLAFDDEPVAFTNPTGAFDLAGRETLVRTDWVSSNTPWLVFDRNANGRIDDGSELFGSMTRLPDGQRAKNGFSALAQLDVNGDGWLTASDPGFAALALWRDLDQNRESSPDELAPLAGSVVALSLDYTNVPRCSAGSCERERATVVFRDRADNERRGSVVDVYLSDR